MNITTRRNITLIIAIITIFILYSITDPNDGILQNMPIGAGTLALIVFLSKALLVVVMVHIARKVLLDYVDFEVLMKKAIQTPTGAGLFAVAASIFVLAIAISIAAGVLMGG